MKHIWQEIRRRNVHRAAIAYLAASWVVLQVAEVLAEIYDVDGASLQWLLPLLAIGLVPALALSWTFELTSGGVRREAELDNGPDGAAAAGRGRRTDRIIIVLLALALSLLAADRFLISRPAPPPTSASFPATIPSVAVLPFLDLSAEGDQAYFASGFAEEMLNLLIRIPGLSVAARSSSFSFQNSNLPVSEIAGRLNVRYVLEGSVRATGERLRISARLIDALSGFHVWSETYERDGGALFDVQEEVAREIAEVLEVRVLGAPPRVERTDPEVYALVLEAEAQHAQATAVSLERAVGGYRRALAIDPTYTRGWTSLSVCYTNMAEMGLVDWDEGHQQALDAAHTALELDPASSPALKQLAWIARTYQADSHSAARYLESALTIEPTSPDLIGDAAVLLQSIGRLPEAIPLHEYSVARDPVNTQGVYSLGLAYYFADRLDAAASQLERVLTLAPHYLGARYRLGTVRLRQGRFEEALREFAAESDEAFAIKGRALALYSLGLREDADAALAELIAGWGGQWPSEVAHVHAWRGETDAAFEWLEKSFTIEGAAGWGEWRLMHLYENLHDDPRWEAFLRRVGASDEQLAAISLRLPEATYAAVLGNAGAMPPA